MAVYTDSYKIYLMVDNVNWTDISLDIIGVIKGEWGIRDSAPNSRLSDTGILQFTLNNSTAKYTPGSDTSLDGFGKNALVKLVITYDGADYIRFFGRISSLEIDYSLTFDSVKVTVTDWLDYAAKFPLTGLYSSSRRSKLAYQTNKRADEVINSLIDVMPIKPLATKLDIGNNIFPAVFDTLNDVTRTYSEFDKLAQSELGYIYLTKDRTYGETLVFENQKNRKGTKELSLVPIHSSRSAMILCEDGDYLVQEDGPYLLFDELESFCCANVFTDISFDYGVVNNHVRVKTYPRRVDTSLQVLFSLDKVYGIGSGETKTFRGTFVDPVASNTKVTGMNMQTPVATTDYLANTANDGSGTNLTGFLSVTADYGASDVLFTVTNVGSVGGYITKLQCRGYGIYTYNPVEYIIEDGNSVNDCGYETIDIDQKYHTDITQGKLFSEKILNDYKEPRVRISKVSFLANNSSQLMNAFLNLDVGSLVNINETENSMNENYYIQSVAFEITEGGLISFEWVVSCALSLFAGLTPIAVEFSGGVDAIDFGYVPSVSNLTNKTICLRFIQDSFGAVDKMLVSNLSDPSGYYLAVGTSGEIIYNQNWNPSRDAFTSASGVISAGTEYSLCISHATDLVNLGPTLFVNGVNLPIPISVIGSGVLMTEVGNNFVIGNINSKTYSYTRPFDGKIWDVRIYDRALTTQEMIDYHNGVDISDENLVFQAPCVYTSRLDKYIDMPITTHDKISDNVFGVIGSPVTGTVMGRNIP